MYESIGFRGAYLVLGLVALGFTLISFRKTRLAAPARFLTASSGE